ncbi:MaoC/PaaZ C-terminal domain-containing protein [Halovivax sp.]|uniref:MaoC/PaaZ C-terminal domain-containing protein n=1 Tax=Halovivax sp. TaxID=1935978 RepID=UPI0025C34C2B|nr:MaoC/PaaZ C-terminal domain-containing protein [Halovivax sp.]
MSAFDEVEVGDTIETAARTVTEADIVNFAGVSGDFNDLHLDAEKMADSDYGERIAMGALVFSMTTGLLWQARGTDSGVVAMYGVDELRFVAPVFVGDTISVESEVVEADPYDHPEASGRVRYEATVTNQHEDVVLTCQLLALVR